MTKVRLLSHHQTVAEIPSINITEVYCMAGNRNAEDLLIVKTNIKIDGENIDYWCDQLEFILQKETNQ